MMTIGKKYLLGDFQCVKLLRLFGGVATVETDRGDVWQVPARELR